MNPFYPTKNISFVLSEKYAKTNKIETAVRTLHRIFELNYPTNIWEYYVCVERLMSLYQKCGKFSESDTIYSKLRNGDTMEFSLCPSGAVLTIIKQNDSRVPIIDETAKCNFDKDILQRLIRTAQLEIGHQTPVKELYELIKEVQVDEAILFEGGSMLLCTKKDTEETVFKICTKETSSTLVSFQNFLHQQKEAPLVFKPYQGTEFFEELYRQIRSKTGNIIPRVFKDVSRAGNIFFETLNCKISNGMTVSFSLGNDKFVVQKKNNSLNWFYTRRAVPTRLIRQYITYLKLAPVETVIERPRKNISFEDMCKEYGLHEKIESLLNEFQYMEIAKEIKQFCKQSGVGVSVKLSSFVDPDSNEFFHPCTYIFFADGEDVRLEKVIYKESGFENIDYILPVNTKDFDYFCKLKTSCLQKQIKLDSAWKKLQEGSQINHSYEFEKEIDALTNTEQSKAFAFDDFEKTDQQLDALIQAFRGR